jgi:hypothetical protein
VRKLISGWCMDNCFSIGLRGMKYILMSHMSYIVGKVILFWFLRGVVSV